MGSREQENSAGTQSGTCILLAGCACCLPGEQSVINEQDHAFLNHDNEYAIDSEGQETLFIMQEEQCRKNLQADLEERKIGSKGTDTKIKEVGKHEVFSHLLVLYLKHLYLQEKNTCNPNF